MSTRTSASQHTTTAWWQRLPHARVSGPALLVYGLAVFLANWLILHVGPVVLPGGTHLAPVGFGLYAPTGAYAAALVLVARDVVQRTAGRRWSLIIIVPATLATAAMDPHLALASGSAFLLAELLDYAVYTPLQQRLGVAVGASAVAGAALDSVWFLLVLGILSWPIFLGLWLAKGYVAVAGGLLTGALRRWIPTVHTVRTTTSWARS